MAVAWTDVQNALVTWVENTTGLGEGAVIWGFQKEPQPERPYMVLRIIPPRRMGQDALIITTNLTQPGQEIQQTVQGQRALTIILEAFTNTVIGAGTATEYLQDALTGLYLPSQNALLFSAGLSYVTYEQPVDLTALEAGTNYVSRAQCRVKFALVDVITETTGYISTIQVTPTVDGTAYPTVTEGPF